MWRTLVAVCVAVVAVGALSACKGSVNDPAGITEVSDCLLYTSDAADE